MTKRDETMYVRKEILGMKFHIHAKLDKYNTRNVSCQLSTTGTTDFSLFQRFYSPSRCGWLLRICKDTEGRKCGKKSVIHDKILLKNKISNDQLSSSGIYRLKFTSNIIIVD